MTMCILIYFVTLKLMNLSVKKKSQTKELNFGPQSALQGFGLWIQFIVGTTRLCPVSVEDTVHPV